MDIPGCKGRENTVVSDTRKHTRYAVTTSVVKGADQPRHSLVVSYIGTYVGLVCLFYLTQNTSMAHDSSTCTNWFDRLNTHYYYNCEGMPMNSLPLNISVRKSVSALRSITDMASWGSSSTSLVTYSAHVEQWNNLLVWMFQCEQTII